MIMNKMKKINIKIMNKMKKINIKIMNKIKEKIMNDNERKERKDNE